MRRLLTWLLVTLGIAALIRRLRRRGAPAEVWTPAPPPPAPPPPVAPAAPAEEDPADELRRKLARSRAPAADEPAEPPTTETVEERRADVHDQARSALGEMRDSDDS